MPLKVLGDAPKLDTKRPGEGDGGERLPPVPRGPAAPGGGYGDYRAQQGPSGTWHWGVDLRAPVDVAVVAPETMSVVAVWTDNETPPFSGYGPAGVLAKGKSGVYHLLGHLDPLAWSDDNRPTKGQTFDAGEQVGFTSPTIMPPHVHWEVRIQPIDSPSTRSGNTLDPLQWLNGFAVAKTGAPSRFPWWLALLALAALSRKR